MDRCESCDSGRPAVATLRRKATRPRASRSAGRISGEHPLCSPCANWLAGVVSVARNAEPGSLLAMPSSAGRRRVFPDQCHVCRRLLSKEGVVIHLVQRDTRPVGWPVLWLCPACDGWLASLASDGRSARGTVSRSAEGPYGSWLFPNLRDICVRLDVADVLARHSIESACQAMNVHVSVGHHVTNGQLVRFFEADGPPPAGALPGDAAEIALAGPADQEALQLAIRAGAVDWLTHPPTPQQVTAALTRVLRHGIEPLLRDPATGLLVARHLDPSMSTLAIEPVPGQDRFELAWMLRRFCRGYDDVAVTPWGQMIVVPHAPRSVLHAVVDRLQALLHGRCTIEPMTYGDDGPQQLDVAG